MPVTMLHGAGTDRPVPLRGLSTAGSGAGAGRVSLESLRGRAPVAVLLPHAAGCAACARYAERLGAPGSLDEVGAARVVVLPAASAPPGPSAPPAPGDRAVVLADDGASGAALRRAGHLPLDGVALLLLDRYLAPRATAWADEADGLPDADDAAGWLGLFEQDCACGLEVEWPEGPATS